MPHLTIYDQLGDMPILGTRVGWGVARSRLGAKVPNLRQKFPLKEDLKIKIMAVFSFIAHENLEKGFKFHAQPQTGAYSCFNLPWPNTRLQSR